METLGALGVLLMGCLKILFAGPVAFGMGYSFLETLLLTTAGSGFGMVFFFFTGTRVLEWFRVRGELQRQRRLARGRASKRQFTRTNRLIVKVKRSYGLTGLALMPPFLSVPITAVVAAKYFRHDRRTLPWLLTSVAAWSLVLTTVWSLIAQ